jgi:hypothetical protein
MPLAYLSPLNHHHTVTTAAMINVLLTYLSPLNHHHTMTTTVMINIADPPLSKAKDDVQAGLSFLLCSFFQSH